jgi:hypothetical protein
MDLKGTGLEIDLAQDRNKYQAPQNMVMNLWVP